MRPLSNNFIRKNPIFSADYGFKWLINIHSDNSHPVQRSQYGALVPLHAGYKCHLNNIVTVLQCVSDWYCHPTSFQFFILRSYLDVWETFFTVNKYAENFPYISPRRRKLYLTLNYTYINIYFHSITIKHFWPRTFEIQIILSQLANIKEPSWWQMRY